MKKVLSLFIVAMMSILTACQGKNEDFIHIYDISLKVDEAREIIIHSNLEDLTAVEYTLDDDGVIIINNQAYGVISGREVEVTARLNNLESKFTIYVSKEEVEVAGSLFDEITIEELSGLEQRSDFIMGADISSIIEVLKWGGRFFNKEGNRVSVFKILKDAGVNYVRIRLWNDPFSETKSPYGGGNNSLEVAKQIGSLASAFGMKILLNFHYSDFWADPAKQVIPKAWSAYTSSDEVAQALYNFTFDSLKAMEAVGAKVDMVQIGNEITPGLITQGVSNYNDISSPSSYSLNPSINGSVNHLDNYIKYLKSGLQAARAANPDIQTMIHIDRGGNNKLGVDYFNRLLENEVDFDIIGLSYYIFYHGSFNNFKANIEDLAVRFGKKIVVAETSYAYTNAPTANAAHILTEPYYNYPLSVQGQADMIRDIIKATVEVPNALGLGIFYWEPAWLPVSNAGWAEVGTPGTWANQAVFSYEGIVLPSIEVFKK